jgi:hypothetical protein
MDATDTAVPETRYRGRSQALLYETIKPHASLGYKPPAPEAFVPAFTAWPAAGSAGHASATASLKLTFHLDHSVGANHGSGQPDGFESSLLQRGDAGFQRRERPRCRRTAESLMNSRRIISSGSAVVRASS